MNDKTTKALKKLLIAMKENEQAEEELQSMMICMSQRVVCAFIEVSEVREKGEPVMVEELIEDLYYDGKYEEAISILESYIGRIEDETSKFILNHLMKKRTRLGKAFLNEFITNLKIERSEAQCEDEYEYVIDDYPEKPECDWYD